MLLGVKVEGGESFYDSHHGGAVGTAVASPGRALVKKVVFDEVQGFPTNSTMQNPACVKREKFRSENGFHGGCGIVRECG